MNKLTDKISQLTGARWLWGFAIIFAALCVGLIAMEITNFNYGGIWLRDFQVFHRAGGRVISGENLFQPARDGFYSYKYSPTAALLFVPFSLLPLKIAEAVYWLFVSGLMLVGLYLSLSLIRPDFRRGDAKRLGLLLVLAGLILGVHVWSELTLGQVNLMLTVMFIAIAFLYDANRPVLLAFVWALSLFIKPFGLILLPYFLLKKRFRETMLFAGFTALLFLAPAVFYGGGFLAGQQYWYRQMSEELAKKTDLFQPGNHTLVSISARYLSLDSLGLSASNLNLYRYLVLALAVGLALFVLLRGGRTPRPAALDFAFLLALTPLVAYTNSNSFIMVELAVMVLLVDYGRLRTWEKAMAVGGFLLVGGNFYDQLPFDWGVGFYEYYNSVSLLSVGTLLLLASLVSLRWRESHRPAVTMATAPPEPGMATEMGFS